MATTGQSRRAGAVAQVFVADPATPVLARDDHHHLVRVLRLAGGEQVVAADGAGRWCLCRFAGDRAGPERSLEPEGDVVNEPATARPLTVAFAPVKGDRPEWVVQKLTELGIDRIVPLRTDRSVVHWEGDRGTKAVARLTRVAREAAAQSRRVWLPEITEVATLTSFADTARHTGDAVALAEAGGSPPTLERPAVAVGPEGGWSRGELDRGLPTVGLSPGVLRAETAAVVAGALLGALRAGTVAPSRAGPALGEA